MGRRFIISIIALTLLTGRVLTGQALAEDEKTQFFPILAYRTGPFAAGGSVRDAARLANYAASQVVSERGTSVATPDAVRVCMQEDVDL